MPIVTFIIPIESREAANQAALQFDPFGGDRSFGLPCLSKTGQEPATHCWASGVVSDAIYAEILPIKDQFSARLYPDISPDAALEAAGLRRVHISPLDVRGGL